MKISGAIFDLDGTLIDSMPVWFSLVDNYLRDNNKDPEEGLGQKMLPMTVTTASVFLHQNYLPEFTPEEIRAHINGRVKDQYENLIPAKHGVKNFLFALKCSGARMCVATATDKWLAEAALRRLNMFDYFTCVLACSDLNTTKETPDIYDRAFDILGTPKDTTYVFEDAYHCVVTAKNAGYRVVGVSEDTAVAEREKIKKLADVFINDYDDFRGMI